MKVSVLNYEHSVFNLTFILLSGDADPDTYDQDQFDEDEATEMKNPS